MEGGREVVVGEAEGAREREAWQTVGEAEASSAVLCVEGALNSLSKGGGEGRQERGRRREGVGI